MACPSSCAENRPLLAAGESKLRLHKAVYVSVDAEVSQFWAGIMPMETTFCLKEVVLAVRAIENTI